MAGWLAGKLVSKLAVKYVKVRVLSAQLLVG
jgi:hypothetical protein